MIKSIQNKKIEDVTIKLLEDGYDISVTLNVRYTWPNNFSSLTYKPLVGVAYNSQRAGFIFQTIDISTLPVTLLDIEQLIIDNPKHHELKEI